jgi:acetyltransferase-like isoleucine patch superfamily enzyme
MTFEAKLEEFITTLRAAYRSLRAEKRVRFGRRVAFGDLISERDDNAADYGFGEGTTCYDNVLILGNVTVGRNCWIGPNVVLDGSAPLIIGDHVDISAGVQIYTHDTVRRATSGGAHPPETSPTRIGSQVYVGPNTIICRGVTIGDGAVIGAMSFVDRDIPSGGRAWGIPARLRSPTEEGSYEPRG